MLKRRDLLKASLLGTLAGQLPLSWQAMAADTAVDRLSLADGISLVSGLGGNVLAYAGDQGLLLVDSGAPGQTARLLDILGGDKVSVLFNSHWHQEQVGGNAEIGASGARLIAHERTRLRLATDFYLPAEDRYQRALPAEAQPAETFYTDAAMEFNGSRIDYGYLPLAHTDGDIYVYLREADLVAVGDALSPAVDPVFDWGAAAWLGGRIDSLKKLLSLTGANTRFVPSRGEPVGRDYVEAELAFVQAVYDRMVDMIRMGFTPEDMLANGVLDGLRPLRDPEAFVYDANKGLWAHHNKLEPNIV